MNTEKKAADQNETLFGDLVPKKDPKARIFRAQLLLFIFSGLTAYGMIRSLPRFEMLSLFPLLFFSGMAIWAKYNPVVALSIALIVWLGINIYAFATDEEHLYVNVIVQAVINLIVIALLGLGIREALQLKKQEQ